MLGFFPDPYPDELFYSVLARLWDKIGCPNRQAFARAVFGSGEVIPHIGFPHGIDCVISNIPKGHHYTSDSLIDEHTLLPVYQPFLPQCRVDSIRKALHGSRRGAVQFLIGQKASSVTVPQYLRFCPRCVKETRETYGECYWHRSHQVPGVEVCAEHKVWLEDCHVPAKQLTASHAFMSAERNVPAAGPRMIRSQEPAADARIALAQNVAWVLAHPHLQPDQEGIRRRYLALLAERDLATYGGRLRAHRLMREFVGSYPQSYLRHIEGELGALSSGRAVLALGHRIRGTVPPLYHLLFMHFLGHSAQTFFATPRQPEHFGLGPWPCLNRAASHFHEWVIKDCTITIREEDGKPVGRFQCGCGFVYMRVGPDWSPLIRFHATRVLAYGPTWDRTAQTLWMESGLRVDQISDQLGISPSTLRAQLRRLGLPCRRQDSRARLLLSARARSDGPCKSGTSAYRLRQRQRWITYINGVGGVGMKKQTRRKVYGWLYRHDRVWLKTHSKDQQRARIGGGQRQQVQWQERDQTYAKLLSNIAQSLRATAAEPRRWSRGYLLRTTGQFHRIAPNLKKLPATQEVLRKYVESHRAYAIRRVSWAETELRKKGQSITRTALLDKVRRGKGRVKDRDFMEAIEAALNTFSEKTQM